LIKRLAGDAVAGQPEDVDLDRLLAERGDHLLRAAIALAGNRADGEDLLQAAMERLLRNRRRVHGDLEGYLRRILYNLAADGWRRRAARERNLQLFRLRGVTGADATYSPGLPDATSAVDLRDALVRLLAQLPPHQRTTIVLRYWVQLGEAEIASILGCSEGAVKSSVSRGMARLRELAVSWQEAEKTPRSVSGGRS
jgi:RNA polymerase sigma factor (sigma-70 family)